jgi:hypothetical protein
MDGWILLFQGKMDYIYLKTWEIFDEKGNLVEIHSDLLGKSVKKYLSSEENKNVNCHSCIIEGEN